MAPPSPSPQSSFLPNFRFRRPPWETRNDSPTIQTSVNPLADDVDGLGQEVEEHGVELGDGQEHNDEEESEPGEEGADGENEGEEEEEDEEGEEGAIEEGV